jgi:c-di-AMP phosphodiesterase-like protein
MKYTIVQFIPIIIFFLWVSYPQEFVVFSNFSIGRFIAVCIIIFYSSLDKYLGLFICGLVILFYQAGYIENMNNVREHFQDIAYSMMNENLTIAKEIFLENKPLGYTLYDSLYANITSSTVSSKNEVLKNEFRKEHCNNDVLKYKESNVKTEMVEHIFPQISFTGKACNPCSQTCGFSIIESKIAIEEQMKPISTLP